MNAPKFTSNDIPLFEWITADVFPGATLPGRPYERMLRKMDYVCALKRLQPTDAFKKKCTQLYETIMVRHGLMLVGQTLSGKSKVIDVLSESL